jgi:hypothetical protein
LLFEQRPLIFGAMGGFRFRCVTLGDLEAFEVVGLGGAPPLAGMRGSRDGRIDSA